MMIEESIFVKNYKCFDSSGGGFERILPINVIIGKNNSGKSSLIELIRFIIQTHDEFLNIGRDNSKSEVIITHRLTKQEIEKSFGKTAQGGGIPTTFHFEYGRQFIDKSYSYSLLEKGLKVYKSINAEFIPQAEKYIADLAQKIEKPFLNKSFCNITAERNVVPEKSTNEIIFEPNGFGVTNSIQQIINRTNRDSNLIEVELLKELNIIVSPDIKFTRILVQLNNDDHWELFFENSQSDRIALSKMGSGIKTIIMVLLNLIVRPAIDRKARNHYVFAFEELENNLHPALQRRLYDYIKNYSEKNSAYFFITTHSNVVIDSFGTYKNSQLIHVINDRIKSSVSTVLSYEGSKQIISDLGLKASDILQSNGVIWVEGPSDRNYINKWLEILAPELKEGLHFSIMFYGGRLLSNLSFDFDWFNKDVIPLLKINKNAFVVIDRDGKNNSIKLNNTKIRISEEIGFENNWITKGREIENYLSDTIIEKWLFEKHGYRIKYINDKNTKLEKNILISNSKVKLSYNLNKTLYSSEIAEYIDSNSLDILDLKGNILNLIIRIKQWNK